MDRIVYNAVMETEVKFSEINFTEACRMIALTSSEQECRLGPLRRFNQGTRPGISKWVSLVLPILETKYFNILKCSSLTSFICILNQMIGIVTY